MKLAFSPTKFEQPWLEGTLALFADSGWFEDVLFRISSGKEATVYCCQAKPWTGLDLLAAKVYRPRAQRTMHSYAAYREGRPLTRDRRLQRALRKRSRAGVRVQDAEWIGGEYAKMCVLHELGADIPRPLDCAPNAVLMEYIGDHAGAAPRLSDVAVPRRLAQPLFERLLRNVELFLQCRLIHADLSAHNVLLWDDAPFVIDFPQGVDPTENPNALALLERDVLRLATHFARFGVAADATGLAVELWQQAGEASWRHDEP